MKEALVRVEDFQLEKFWMMYKQAAKPSGKCIWIFTNDKKLCKCEKRLSSSHLEAYRPQA